MSAMPKLETELVSRKPFVPALFETIERLSILEREIVSFLDEHTEQGIADTRKGAKFAGKFAWRIEVACDAQTVKRAGLKYGVGSDTVRSAVKKRAKEIGCTPRTIFANHQIHNLIAEVEDKLAAATDNSTDISCLDEVGYYRAALTAVNPVDTAIMFAGVKKALKRFRVTDAFRLVEQQGLTKKAAKLKAIGSIRTASRKESFDYLKKLKSFLLTCPDTELFNRLLSDCYDDVHNHIEEMFEEDALKALKTSWTSLGNTEADLAKSTNLPMEIVSRIMNSSCQDLFIKIPGHVPQRWHKVGEPLPPELRRG